MTNAGSIPLATVDACERYVFTIVYVVCTMVSYVRLSCNKMKVEFIFIMNYGLEVLNLGSFCGPGNLLRIRFCGIERLKMQK